MSMSGLCLYVPVHRLDDTQCHRPATVLKHRCNRRVTASRACELLNSKCPFVICRESAMLYVSRRWLIIVAQRRRSVYHALHTAPTPAAAATYASSIVTAATTNGSGSWKPDVYLRPVIEVLSKPAVRSDVVVINDDESQPTDMTTTTSVSDVFKGRDEQKATHCDVKTEDVPSPSKMMTSPETERRLTAVDGGSGSGSSYKYKDNIKRRFCSEGDEQSPSYVDTRSYSSLSDGASSALDYSPSCSPGAVPHTATVRDDRSCRRTIRTAADDQCPGFVLHPSGAYYIPVITATAQVRSLLSATAADDQYSPVVCHPVSIPVRFTGSAATAEVVSVDNAASTDDRHAVQLQRLWMNTASSDTDKVLLLDFHV